MKKSRYSLGLFHGMKVEGCGGCIYRAILEGCPNVDIGGLFFVGKKKGFKGWGCEESQSPKPSPIRSSSHVFVCNKPFAPQLEPTHTSFLPKNPL